MYNYNQQKTLSTSFLYQKEVEVETLSQFFLIKERYVTSFHIRGANEYSKGI